MDFENIILKMKFKKMFECKHIVKRKHLFNSFTFQIHYFCFSNDIIQCEEVNRFL